MAADGPRVRLRVLVVDEQGRRVAAHGLAAWLTRIAPRSARGEVTIAIVRDATVKDMIANEASWKGVRCTYQDNLVNVFGIDPKTGHARNPFDNVGVQYGLAALNDGAISFDQFIDINTRIGGLDDDGKIMAARMVGDPEAISRAYATGRMNEGTGGEASTPFIDLRTYTDGDPLGRGDPNVDVHDRYHSFILRARLLKYNGTAANHVMLVTASYGVPDCSSAAGCSFAQATMFF